MSLLYKIKKKLLRQRVSLFNNPISVCQKHIVYYNKACTYEITSK